MIPIKIKTKANAKVPTYQSSGAAGADVYAFIDEPITLHPGETKLIPTGIFIEIPGGYEAQIRPRSGLALKHGITLLNTPGTIDSDYRGEVKIIITNLGQESFVIENEMRIAQMVFNKVYVGHFIESNTLKDSKRDTGGFGSSGV